MACCSLSGGNDNNSNSGNNYQNRSNNRVNNFDYNNPPRSSVKWKTCPSCGHSLNIVAKKCPYCDYEF